MPYNRYIPISEERYNALMARYTEFLNTVHLSDGEPIKVFDPMTPKIMEEIMLIREVSMELQKKKEEDMKKAQGGDEATDKVPGDTDQVPEGTDQSQEAAESNVNGVVETPTQA